MLSNWPGLTKFRITLYKVLKQVRDLLIVDIRLMLSVSLCSKVIIISSFYCISHFRCFFCAPRTRTGNETDAPFSIAPTKTKSFWGRKNLVENRRTKDSKRKIQTIKISKRKWLSIEPVDNLVIYVCLNRIKKCIFVVFISNGKWWSIESHKRCIFSCVRLILKM